MLEAQIRLNDDESELLFTTPTGRMWRERNFYRDVWRPTQKISGLDIRPMSAATRTSRSCGQTGSTMQTWPRPPGTAWR